MPQVHVHRPELLAGGTICLVCNRPLRHPSSVRMGMGLVCAKNYKQRLETMKNHPEYRQTIENWRIHRNSRGEDELYRAGEFILNAAQQEHIARMKYTTAGAALRHLEHGTAEVPSFERGRGEVQFYQTNDPNVAVAMSDSGKAYAIALSADHTLATWCSCPAHLYSPDANYVCRHRQAYNTAAGAERQHEAEHREEELHRIEAERQEHRRQVDQATQGIVERLDRELATLQRKVERGRLTPAMYEQRVREIEETRALASAIALASTSRVAMANVAQALLEASQREETFNERRHA